MPIINHTFYAPGAAHFRLPLNYIGSTVTAEMWAGSGGDSTFAIGGKGARILCDVPCSADDQIFLEIGGQAFNNQGINPLRNAGGFGNGGFVWPNANAGAAGGGGGRSAFWRNGLLKAVAGGGGGAGQGTGTFTRTTEGNGGDGGFPNGTAGAPGIPAPTGDVTTMFGGTGGTATAGGLAGVCVPSTPARHGFPGDNPNVNQHYRGYGADGPLSAGTATLQGAGGGGYAGGGSGARGIFNNSLSAGGGGGSSWVDVDVALTTFSNGFWLGDGKITLIYGVS